MRQSSPFERRLELAGCYNLRELGGYITTDNKQIRWRKILRSDRLDRLLLSSQQQLIDYGVRTIIDLRSPLEVNLEQYNLCRNSKLKYLNLPLVEDEPEIEYLKNKTLLEHNLWFLEERSPVIKTIFETIATQQTAVVIHCAAGKDRTGIIIALLLALLDVPIATIAEDYQLSSHYLAPFYAKIRLSVIKQGLAHLLESSPQTIINTFDYLDRQYGGINNYLANIGIKLETSDRLRNILVK